MGWLAVKIALVPSTVLRPAGLPGFKTPGYAESTFCPLSPTALLIFGSAFLDLRYYFASVHLSLVSLVLTGTYNESDEPSPSPSLLSYFVLHSALLN